MFQRTGLGFDFDDVTDVLKGAGGQVADVVEHVATGGDMDLSLFALVAGSRFDAGSKALTTVCDNVCGRLGKLLVTVGGGLRVVRLGFQAGVRGGAATFDRLTSACTEYDAAKARLRLAVTAKSSAKGAGVEVARLAQVKAETDVVRAQKKILEALGGSLITASTQKDVSSQAHKVPPPRYAPPRYAPPRPVKKAGVSPIVLVALAAGAVYAATR